MLRIQEKPYGDPLVLLRPPAAALSWPSSPLKPCAFVVVVVVSQWAALRGGGGSDCLIGEIYRR